MSDKLLTDDQISGLAATTGRPPTLIAHARAANKVIADLSSQKLDDDSMIQRLEQHNQAHSKRADDAEAVQERLQAEVARLEQTVRELESERDCLQSERDISDNFYKDAAQRLEAVRGALESKQSFPGRILKAQRILDEALTDT